MFWNNDIAEAIAVILIFLGLSTPMIIVGLVYYLKKRLEHKQVMAAIEKGTPLSELKPAKLTGPLWIKNLTAGIALLIFAIGLVCIQLARGCYFESFGFYFLALILFAFGIARLIRGLLQRKVQRQIQPSDETSAGENKTVAGASTYKREVHP